MSVIKAAKMMTDWPVLEVAVPSKHMQSTDVTDNDRQLGAKVCRGIARNIDAAATTSTKRFLMRLKSCCCSVCLVTKLSFSGDPLQ